MPQLSPVSRRLVRDLPGEYSAWPRTWDLGVSVEKVHLWGVICMRLRISGWSYIPFVFSLDKDKLS